MILRRFLAVFLLALFVAAGQASAAGDADVAALQVALRAKGVYEGTIDGILGPGTKNAVRSLQERSGLAADGVVGKQTRRALAPYGRPGLGSRPLALGARGWDVAELQFLLAWHGFPSATFDGDFGAHLDAAVRRFQRWARLPADGVVGSATVAALGRPLPRSPLALAWPLALPVGDAFGPRGSRFHAGIDIPAERGSPVGAARAGRVSFAGWSDGFGWLVVVAHGRGVRTFYAHLSRIAVRVGARVATGERVGLVGASGHASGPHLHFELHVRGAAVDPLTALP